MRIGIIAEYNPFHLGHKYQIDEIKKRYPDAEIVAIISSYFTQRGDISILDKWQKAEICLEMGVSLIVELPTFYAIQSADIFAKGAIQILNELKIDILCFGVESVNEKQLYLMGETQLYNQEYNNLVKKYIDEGINYPTALNNALIDICHTSITLPNDLLGLSYIKEIIKNNYNITPLLIKRTNDYHMKEINDNNIISANLIRKLKQENKDISKYVPRKTIEVLTHEIDYSLLFNLLKYKIFNNKKMLNQYLTVDEGIENRIVKYIDNTNDWQELVEKIKTKRYTYNKINRMLMHIILDIKKDDALNPDNYIRIIGFTNKGKKIIKDIKKNTKLPIYINYRDNLSNIFKIEYNASYIYSILIKENISKYEYTKKPIIKD